MIHYHGAPLSGPLSDASRFWRGRHSMVSFANPEQLPLVADVCQSFVLDNGAFSTWKSGRAFDYDGYAEWALEWANHPACDWCLIPDVIDGTWVDNSELIHKWTTTGKTSILRNSVPIWHFHEPITWLGTLASRYRTVALGSSGQWPNPGTDGWWQRLAEAMSAISTDGKPHCRLHGLRMLNTSIFTRVPFASADSTNATQNAGSLKRFGTYTPPTAAARATVIAERIEAQNAPAVYLGPELWDGLFAEQGREAAG